MEFLFGIMWLWNYLDNNMGSEEEKVDKNWMKRLTKTDIETDGKKTSKKYMLSSILCTADDDIRCFKNGFG